MLKLYSLLSLQVVSDQFVPTVEGARKGQAYALDRVGGDMASHVHHRQPTDRVVRGVFPPLRVCQHSRCGKPCTNCTAQSLQWGASWMTLL